MLKCREVAEKSSDYLDGNLSRGQRVAFAFHLLICGNCREFIRHMRVAVGYFNKVSHKHLSNEEADKITKRVINSD